VTNHTNSAMLKRQRPVSPPCSTLDLPFDDLNPALRSKRRRTSPPVLDGETEEEDVEPFPDPISGSGGEESSHGSDVATEVYRSTNRFLHDLHALQQHRLHPSSFHQTPSLAKSPLPPSFIDNLRSQSSHPANAEAPDVDRVKQRYEESNKFVLNSLAFRIRFLNF
jgi:hypothetical protein